MKLNKMFGLVCALFLSANIYAETAAPKKTPPPDYVVTLTQPAAYKAGEGPKVLVDEGHNNFQTIADRLKGFAALLSLDNMQVAPLREPFTAKALEGVNVLVSFNALNEKNANEKKTVNRWELPTPSAFTDDEIKVVTEWVKNGGSLLLVADHMPFPGAMEKLGNSLGVIFQNNFAFDAAFTYGPKDPNLIKFYRSPSSPRVGKLLAGNPIADGTAGTEKLDVVVSFTGHAFRMKPGVAHTPILELGQGVNLAWPIEHAEITPKTPFSQGEGFLQGAILNVGKGRVAVFGEASMFSTNWAEWNDNYPMGFQNPQASDNKQFILNVMHWLAGKR